MVGMPPSTFVAPPKSGSIQTLTTVPPVRMAYKAWQMSGQNGTKHRLAHRSYVTQLVPSDGEELQWVDEDSSPGNVPKCKYYNGIDDDL